MPIFVVTGFPASYDPPEDESIVLPPGAGRRIKGVPFGVTEDTAAVLRTLSYLDEVTDEVEEIPPAATVDDPPDPAREPEIPTPAEQELTAAAYAALVADPPATNEPEPVKTGRPGKSKE